MHTWPSYPDRSGLGQILIFSSSYWLLIVHAWCAHSGGLIAAWPHRHVTSSRIRIWLGRMHLLLRGNLRNCVANFYPRVESLWESHARLYASRSAVGGEQCPHLSLISGESALSFRRLAINLLILVHLLLCDSHWIIAFGLLKFSRAATLSNGYSYRWGHMAATSPELSVPVLRRASMAIHLRGDYVIYTGQLWPFYL